MEYRCSSPDRSLSPVSFANTTLKFHPVQSPCSQFGGAWASPMVHSLPAQFPVTAGTSGSSLLLGHGCAPQELPTEAFLWCSVCDGCPPCFVTFLFPPPGSQVLASSPASCSGVCSQKQRGQMEELQGHYFNLQHCSLCVVRLAASGWCGSSSVSTPGSDERCLWQPCKLWCSFSHSGLRNIHASTPFAFHWKLKDPASCSRHDWCTQPPTNIATPHGKTQLCLWKRIAELSFLHSAAHYSCPWREVYIRLAADRGSWVLPTCLNGKAAN